MSSDGRVILAYMEWDTDLPDPIYDLAATETYIWDDVNGIRNLPSIIVQLDERGLDRRGWSFSQGLKLSGDGKVLIGRVLCDGTPTLYRLVLPDEGGSPELSPRRRPCRTRPTRTARAPA